MTDAKGYSRAQIILHWLTVILVLTAFFTHEAMEDALDALVEAGGGPYPTPHTMAGIAVLLIALIRLWLRHSRGAPEPEGAGLQKTGAIWGHRLLYLLMIAVPIGGAAVWFGGLTDLGDLHGIGGQLLMVVFLGHAGFALWHHYVKKDGTLRRMTHPE